MCPQNTPQTGQQDLFRSRTEDIAHATNPLVILAKSIDWESFNKSFGEKFHPSKGRPGLSTRLMVGLHYLKHAYNLSDEMVLSLFVESPQWQCFCGQEYYLDEPPCDRSSMSYWRKRIGSEKMELLLKETLMLGSRLGFIKENEFKSAVIDTSVQEKAIAFPTDSRLYFKSLKMLVRLSKDAGIKLRQTYKRVSKVSLLKQARLRHQRKFREAKRHEKKLKTYLGRVLREIERKGGEEILKRYEKLSECVKVSWRICKQKRNDKDKVYSVHSPEVQCYSKGKAHKKYEFGSKVSVAVSVRGSWVLGIKSFTESISDVLTLKPAVLQVQEITGMMLKRVYVDKGYKGVSHHPEKVDVWMSGEKRSAYGRRLMRRRSCVEATIGHLKLDGRMGRNFLLGREGDETNAVLCGCGHNLRKLMVEVRKVAGFLCLFLRRQFFLEIFLRSC